MELPGKTVTFLFTDIEGSTKLWEAQLEAMRFALARHDALAAAVLTQHRGTLVKSRGEGDSLFAVFPRAADAVAAACALQRAFVAEPWPAATPLRVRMALHTGEADLRDADYYGSTVNRCARLRASGHGGQILLSEATCAQVAASLPANTILRDLGHHRLKDLQQPEHVHQLCHPDLPSDFPPLRSLNYLLHNLPQQLTSFIGREQELAEIKGLLADTRLLTLIGAGGCGKTRLALQVAADLLDGDGDGVWLVELAPISDPALVPQSVASVLKVSEEPHRPLTQTLADYLKSRKLLLVLDNCEHVLGACALLIDAILRACPEVTVLASSREGLGIAGERLYRVPSLSLPDLRRLPPAETLAQYESVRLFSERAQSHQPAFAVSQSNARAVSQICLRLDGIPLAIELAAAKVRVLSVEQIATRLDDRFRLLTGGSRTALPRQQTLRALIDWSYDLLSAEERALLENLSVFAGGWTLEAAEAVCDAANPPPQPLRRGGACTGKRRSSGGSQDRLATGSPQSWGARGARSPDVLSLLTQLVDKSLVIYEAQAEPARYRLLETVRQYARDKLLESGRSEWARDRHRDWFLKLAEEADRHLHGPEQMAWLQHLETEHDNLRAARRWCEGEMALHFAATLFDFWHIRCYFTEGRECLVEALEHPDAQKPTSIRAQALKTAAALAFMQGDYETARTQAEESQAIARNVGEKQTLASALNILGLVLRCQGDKEAARLLHEESLAICEELHYDAGRATALGNLGLLAERGKDYDKAGRLVEAALAIERRQDNRLGTSRLLTYLGLIRHFQGNSDEAISLCRDGLALQREPMDRRIVYEGMAILAIALCAQGKWHYAARLFSAAESLMKSLNARIPASHQGDYDKALAETKQALGNTAFAAAWAEGSALSPEQALALALTDP